jgi:hypothetical protein
MPGAFEPYGRAAPLPDPEDFSFGPRRQPYDHVPTTGEVRNLSRPTDAFRDRIAQDVFDASPLALGPAAYSAVRNLGEGIRDQDLGQAAMGGAESLSMFLGLPAARRLAAAGKIAPGGRGSEEMLGRAQESWAGGADPRKVWDDTGWASGKEFGAFSDGRTPQPVMWHGAPEIELRNYDPGIQRGSVDQLVEGIEDLKIAEPGLENMPMKTWMNSTLTDDIIGGSVAVRRNPMYVPLSKGGMEVQARTPDEMRSLLLHETQHAVDDLPGLDLRAAEGKAPIFGTKAQEIWDAAAKDALNVVQNKPPGMPSREYDRIRDAGASARSFWGKAPEHAAYLNAPQELKARGAASIYSYGTPQQQLEGVYPGDLDFWSKEAFDPIKPPHDPVLGENPLISYRDYKRP